MNGWANYETWFMFTYISNDSGLYDWMEEIVRESKEQEYPNLYIEERMKERWEEEEFPTAIDGWEPYYGLLMAALSQINWLEIADYWIKKEGEENG